MDKITIKRYENPTSVGYQGYIEPEDKSWILYIGVDGKPLFFPQRAPAGRVLCEGLGEHGVPATALDSLNTPEPSGVMSNE